MKNTMRAGGAVIALAAVLLASTAFAEEPWPAPPPVENIAKPAWMDYKDPYAGEQNDVANANRTADEITAWAARAATEALSLSPDDIMQKIATAKPSFSEAGWKEFAEYMRSAQMIELVRDKRYNSSAILSGDAIVLNSGTVLGVYRWLVQAPVMISFTESGQNEPRHTGNFRLTIQLARATKTGHGRDGIVIESWKMERADAAPVETGRRRR